ncbi:M2 family metallopeptidase [Aquisalinus flavus]|uniref:Peptidase M2 n=1 Tax=Aquisalinus flavus TaxID=1526572 RepID=A0A8J2Y330_9PROT|nr:M2 family metallopeptidase [Aquisalinus flavus]MBD0427102.1 M2 family metallopeptidase [Aquisalinus flavus]UNE46924.1 M2 family metallopeptidase [Aquisalinus flavus]GGC98390.1 peptidase M2 [Aquisalinus flavus]
MISGNKTLYKALAGVSVLALIACSEPAVEDDTTTDAAETATEETREAAGEPTVEEAEAFVADAEAKLAEMSERASVIAWTYSTDITPEHEQAYADIDAASTKLSVDLANGTKRFQDLDLPPVLQRKMNILRGGITIPAPSRDGAAQELAQLNTALSSAYSTGKIQFEGETVPQAETELLMRNLTDPAKLEEVWTKWREQAKPSRDEYAQMVELANAGARELGFDDVGQMWRSGYDMDADAFAAEVDRLWGQVRPLYENLQCHVKYKLNEEYGDEIVPLDQPIRADLLGNMWAQQWGSTYPRVKPETPATMTSIDLDALLVEADYTPVSMTETAEEFFTSLGFAPLPETFWERSQFVQPEDREVVCHASAWDLDNREDLRIKMCMTVGAEDFRTVHHELGHNFYQRAYMDQPHLFKNGANDGFHEAIGDMIALSITPEYMQQIGLLDDVPGTEGDLELLMQQALEKVAFLPFGLLVDKWRWQVFAGELTPETYNQGWWDLREEYQGIRPPNERPADAFDPGSKYHVPNNVPYMRYFLAHILQFQFYKAACDQVGWEGPLHRCSFYGSEEVGERFNAMMEMGQSQPWPDTLEMFTGTREMDGSAVIAYFAPLNEWLEEQNADRTCGW